MQGRRTSGASGFPGSVRDAVRAGSAGFGTEVFDVYLSGELAFFKQHRYYVVVHELHSFDWVNVFLLGHL